MADFSMNVRVDIPIEQALDRTRTALAEEGFGILSEIDVAATLKAKLDVYVPQQVILGACNAPLAREGLHIEPDLGLLLPCNVVVRADEDGRTLVSALDPETMVSISGRRELQPVARDAQLRLERVLRRVSDLGE